MLEETADECACTKSEVVTIIENLYGGNTLAKLVDQYNYMMFTMPTEYDSYRKKLDPQIRALVNLPLNNCVND
jgi:hypothetical protein